MQHFGTPVGWVFAAFPQPLSLQYVRFEPIFLAAAALPEVSARRALASGGANDDGR
jgi:hypothetical protein